MFSVKRFLIFLVLLIALMIWFEDWSSSGRMDAFIQEHSDPKITPNLLFFIGESCYTAQDSKGAGHYYRWLVESYPDFEYIARVRYHLALSCEDNGDRGRAMEQYVILKDSFTGTDYARMAKKKWELSRF